MESTDDQETTSENVEVINEAKEQEQEAKEGEQEAKEEEQEVKEEEQEESQETTDAPSEEKVPYSHLLNLNYEEQEGNEEKNEGKDENLEGENKGMFSDGSTRASLKMDPSFSLAFNYILPATKEHLADLVCGLSVKHNVLLQELRDFASKDPVRIYD